MGVRIGTLFEHVGQNGAAVPVQAYGCQGPQIIAGVIDAQEEVSRGRYEGMTDETVPWRLLQIRPGAGSPPRTDQAPVPGMDG
jgi:hypothetical protein